MTTLEERATRSASDVLSWSRSLVDPALRAAVSKLPASMRQIAGYHFGWLDQQGLATPGGEGKALRPALVMACAEAVGGHAEDALPAAVAVELVHNFSLVHDDVMDADITRRHRPTAWSVFGVNQAILSGDTLLALAFEAVGGNGPAVRTLSAAIRSLADGQSADLSFEQRSDVNLTEALLMAQRKTGALLSCSCVLGGLYGGGSAEQIAHLSDFGARLGVAFQVVDDLLGIWGDPRLTGKPVYSDLRNRKKTLPVVAALMSASPAAEELATLYHADHPLSRTDLVRAAELVDTAGGRQWCLTQIDEQMSAALRHLRDAGLTEQGATALDRLTQLATRRDF